MINALSNPKGAINNIILGKDWSKAPVTLANTVDFTATQITTGTTTIAPVLTGNRFAANWLSDNVDTQGYELQSKDGFAFVDTGDFARIRFAINWDAGFSAHDGLFVGFSIADTTLYNATLASMPSDFVGLHKATTGTALNFVTRDDSGTTQSATAVSGLADSTWYDCELDIIKTGTNTGRMTLKYGVNSLYGASFAVSKTVTKEFTTGFPDSDQVLRFSIAVQGDTTNAVSRNITDVAFICGKGNV